MIGGWTLGRRIGQGGMGAVHLATRDGRQGAFKLMHPQMVGQGDFRARFLREAAVLRAVRHRNVVEMLDHGEDQGWLYLVMEYVSGGDLAAHLRRRGTLFEKEAVAIIARCCHGLVAIHAAGLIHRDLKPENIFLTPGPAGASTEPKIGDLGMARHAGGDDRMTMTGTACGTPAYMAPEQIRGSGDLDSGVDVYAMGATLFTLLTGRAPFDGATAYVLTHAVLSQPVPDMRKWNQQLTPGVIGLVEKAMAKDRTQRHRDVRELLLDLERLAEGKIPVASAPLPSPASMVFNEVVGQAAPRRSTSSVSVGGALSGVAWGPILRLGLPALMIIGLMSAASWMMERRLRPGDGPKKTPADATAPAPGLECDSLGALVHLPIAGRNATLRWCPPGRFKMGSPPGEPGHRPPEELHAVQLSHGFWILDSEVSLSLWQSLVGESAATTAVGEDPAMPMTSLTLAQVQDWLDRLNRLHPGLAARLPSEAEWEYACRAGSDQAFASPDAVRACTHPGVLAAWNDPAGGLFAAENAWLLDREAPNLRPLAVTAAGTNANGLIGMHGNVAEWCLDRWDGDSSSGSEARVDPVGQFGGLNVIRGGSWLHPLSQCRSAARLAADPGDAKAWLGFRFVVPAGQTPNWPPR